MFAGHESSGWHSGAEIMLRSKWATSSLPDVARLFEPGPSGFPSGLLTFVNKPIFCMGLTLLA